ncbi:MAG: disulfide bond formation protein B [Alphaproteobacteria bacterium]|jgi:disulfide bond formation protein DsbB|nr:disulfide bond formation protein B [Alphaproteobacteria bacterium]
MFETLIHRVLDDPRIAPLATLALSLATLAGAYGSQHWGGLQPCVLCLYQRWPWWIAAGIAALALALVRHRGVRRGLLALAGVALLAGGGIAVYHVGVEQHWWAGTASCGATGAVPTTLEELKRQVLSAPVVRCDEVQWSLFGISMAGYNAMLSFVAGLALLAFTQKARKGNAA